MNTTTDIHNVEAVVREVLGKHGRLVHDVYRLPKDASLGDAGLTSLASVNVMLALEAEFGEIPEALLTRSVFRSISSITRAMQSLTA
ncbi:phosphopantetheine-binding protein [Variovorax robiniae]|uniref:Phosphopantetheine-binding protein n=1 Tax=Variovorax robiniae TaxID=1836199 RepID=A0ABU8X9K7_9BURK